MDKLSVNNTVGKSETELYADLIHIAKWRLLARCLMLVGVIGNIAILLYYR